MAVTWANVEMSPFQQDILTGLAVELLLWIMIGGMICLVDVRRLWLFR